MAGTGVMRIDMQAKSSCKATKPVVEKRGRMVPKMSITPLPAVAGRPSCRALLLALGLMAAPAGVQAQDSFVRLQDPATGEPLLSVLGTGLGLSYAGLVLDLACPRPEAWTMVVRGVRAPDGTPVAFGFGDPGGRWAEVRVVATGYLEQGISLSLDRATLRTALNRARADYPDAEAAEARLVIGDALGVAVSRDALVREMSDFARACDAQRRPVLARRQG